MPGARCSAISTTFATRPDELPAGTRLMFGQYTIKSFVNSGGFGIVYLATDSLDRTVVIKECFPSALCRRFGQSVGARSRSQQDDFRTAVRQFVQEAVTLSQLDHPNIVKVHQIFECNETAYMAMDYIEGYDLLQTVEGSAPPLGPKEIIAHLTTMLDAIGHVHAHGLLHRDISPDNMILDPRKGQPVLIDFGASRKEVTRKSRAVSGLRVVKDGYSPQEFYVVGSKQAPCSDLYALAASFYHLISGETPKTSQERLAALAGREGDPLRPLAGRFRGYPTPFLAAIDKAMAIFPRDRLQSVEEWRAMAGLPGNGAVQGSAVFPVALPAAPAPVRPDVATFPAETAAPRTQAEEPPVVASAAPVATDAEAAYRATEPGGRGLGARLPAPGMLMAGAAVAVALLVGLLGLSGHLARGEAPVAQSPAPPTVASAAGTPAERTLPVVNMLRLPNGLTFEAVDTATGTQTVVAEVPPGAETTLEPGDVLLIYSATGEMLGSATALRDILKREFEVGVSTYGFVVRRGESTVDAEFRLGVAG
ncbi:MAG: serine/threonine protein kinase [Tabrizicola sp.]